MKSTNQIGSRSWCARAALATFVCLATASTSLAAKGFKQHNLVSDEAGTAVRTDPNLVNPWGIAISDQGIVWVSNAETRTSTVYRQNGAPVPDKASRIVVQIPTATREGGGPTGVVLNRSDAFVINANGASGAALFIFATLGGTIAAWNGNVDPTNAIVVADRSSTNAVYTGLAISDEASGNLLYAANFKGGQIDVFDGTFQYLRSFTDPDMEVGYAPFNVQAIGNQLFVTYAKVGEDEEETGPGLGIIDVFGMDGTFVRRFASHGELNAPWGVALAPSNFGDFSNMLLVGNFGDGHINVFDMTTGEPKGQLASRNGDAIEIEGLWGIAFGVGEKSNVLLFNAGIDDEKHGLFGSIKKQGNSSSGQ